MSALRPGMTWQTWSGGGLSYRPVEARCSSTERWRCWPDFTLAVDVVLWVASAITFQADMGLLHAFRFLWNRFGILILLAALTTTAAWIVVLLASTRRFPGGLRR